MTHRSFAGAKLLIVELRHRRGNILPHSCPTPAVVCRPGQPTSLVILDDAHWLSRSAATLLRPLLQARWAIIDQRTATTALRGRWRKLHKMLT